MIVEAERSVIMRNLILDSQFGPPIYEGHNPLFTEFVDRKLSPSVREGVVLVWLKDGSRPAISRRVNQELWHAALESTMHPLWVGRIVDELCRYGIYVTVKWDWDHAYICWGDGARITVYRPEDYSLERFCSENHSACIDFVTVPTQFGTKDHLVNMRCQICLRRCHEVDFLASEIKKILPGHTRRVSADEFVDEHKQCVQKALRLLIAESAAPSYERVTMSGKIVPSRIQKPDYDDMALQACAA